MRNELDGGTADAMVPEELHALFAVTPSMRGLKGSNQRHYEALLAEYQRFEGNLIPCVGAGMSAPVYPLWGESLSTMTALIPHIPPGLREQILTSISRGEYDYAASHVYDSAGRAAFEDTLRQLFNPTRAAPESVARMPVSLLPQVFTAGPVLTLNFDTLLESTVYTGDKAFGDHIIRGPAYFTQDRQDLIRGTRRTLLKMHGCATRPREVVFTRQQYDGYYGSHNDSSNSRFLSLLFQAHPVLFIGCSLLSDRMMALLLDISQENDLPHFALLPAPLSKQDFGQAGRTLADVGIRPIWYPAGKHSFVKLVLESMQHHSGKGKDADSEGADSDAEKRDSPSVAPHSQEAGWCVGRDVVVDEVWTRLSGPASGQAIEIQGGPGIGKSTVCRAVLAVAREMGWQVADVPLSQVTSKAGALVAILAAVRGQHVAGAPIDSLEREDSLEDVLKDAMSATGPRILYLDNMEDPQADPDFVHWLLAAVGAEGWRILYSTQTAILHPGIFRYQLGPLAVADAEVLFRARWGSTIQGSDADALSKLVEEAGCHPLSLVLIASQRDRWRTVPEVLNAWRREAHDFHMGEAEPRHRSIAIAYGLASERVARDAGCRELLVALATVPDFLTVSAMELVLASYPPLRTNEFDPLTVLIRNGLVDSSVRYLAGAARTAYSVLNPLKVHILSTVDDSTRRRAVQRMSKAYEAILNVTSEAGDRLDLDDWEGAAATTAFQAGSLLTTSDDLDDASAARLLHAMRNHTKYLPTGLRLMLSQRRSRTATVMGPARLAGRLTVLSSGRALVPLLLAAASREGVSRIRNVQRTSEADEVSTLLKGVGLSLEWSNDGSEVVITRGPDLDLSGLDAAQAVRNSWSALLPFLFVDGAKRRTFPVRCHLAEQLLNLRSALRLISQRTSCTYEINDDSVVVDPAKYENIGDRSARRMVLTSFDSLSACVVLIAVSQIPGRSVLVNVPWSYEIGEVCAYLRGTGVAIDGLETSTLEVTPYGANVDATYAVTPDPRDAMCLFSAAVITRSRLRIDRVPIEHLDVELQLLKAMGVKFEGTAEYPSENGMYRLVDIEVFGDSENNLQAPHDKIYPDQHGGVAVDLLPFFVVLASYAVGDTLVHDWVHKNGWMDVGLVRLLLDLVILGGSVEFLDSFRVLVRGPARWLANRVELPEKEGPAMCLLLACLGVAGEVEIGRFGDLPGDVELLVRRLNTLGAGIERT